MTVSIDHFLTVAAVITPRTQTGAPDRYGIPAWIDGDPIDAMTWWHPLDTAEQIERPAGTVTVRAYFLAAVPIDTLARVTIADAGTFEVAAPPATWRHPVTGDQFKTVELIAGPDPESGS